MCGADYLIRNGFYFFTLRLCICIGIAWQDFGAATGVTVSEKLLKFPLCPVGSKMGLSLAKAEPKLTVVVPLG